MTAAVSFLSFAAEFVTAASAMPGVQTIAVLGSILTTKVDPKDIDLLVEIADDMELSDLAKSARGLKGRTQGLNRGADVFLRDPGGTYLGRTCSWRHCRPGIRASCDADHCGGRPYLHDDLSTVSLDPVVIKEPPLEVWPRIIIRTTLPTDVVEWLQKLQEPAA